MSPLFPAIYQILIDSGMYFKELLNWEKIDGHLNMKFERFNVVLCIGFSSALDATQELIVSLFFFNESNNSSSMIPDC